VEGKRKESYIKELGSAFREQNLDLERILKFEEDWVKKLDDETDSERQKLINSKPESNQSE
jgi:hypothetical protein